MAGPNLIRALGIPLRFSYNLNGIAHLGSGLVSDLSRGGVRFQTGSPPPGGAEVELTLAWPFDLQMVHRRNCDSGCGAANRFVGYGGAHAPLWIPPLRGVAVRSDRRGSRAARQYRLSGRGGAGGHAR